jgi:hypothetical protein
MNPDLEGSEKFTSVNALYHLKKISLIQNFRCSKSLNFIPDGLIETRNEKPDPEINIS